MTAFHILSALLLPLLIPFVNRRLHGRDLVWMMPKDFGVSPEDELRGMISNQEDVMSFSQKAGEFCTAKGKSERTSYLTSLVIEEVATNVVQHGFTKDDRDNTLSIRLVDKGDELIMRFRDDSPGFDPRSKYESLFANPDISRMIGLRMIMAEAKEVDYTSVFRLNNLIIRIDAASEHS
jgi:anti-sigma regulatory factor (Ser/Thr protein kinase)